MENVKISVLLTGERVISKVNEATRDIDGKTHFIGYIFENPQIVDLNEEQTLMEDTSDSVSIILKPWMGLSKDEQFLIPAGNIMTMCDPLEEVRYIYESKVGESENA
jgi:hypothetical protein